MAQVLFREGLEPGINKIPRCKRRGGSTSDDRGWPVSLDSTACQQENTAERSDSFSYGIHRAFLLAKKQKSNHHKNRSCRTSTFRRRPRQAPASTPDAR